MVSGQSTSLAFSERLVQTPEMLRQQINEMFQQDSPSLISVKMSKPKPVKVPANSPLHIDGVRN